MLALADTVANSNVTNQKECQIKMQHLRKKKHIHHHTHTHTHILIYFSHRICSDIQLPIIRIPYTFSPRSLWLHKLYYF